MNRATKSGIAQLLLLLTLTVIATLMLEHSQWDVRISELFYSDGHWLLEKGAQPYRFLFYDGPKLLLILFGIYLLMISIWRYRQRPHSNANTTVIKPSLLKPTAALSGREIGYLLLVIIVVPTIIATLKSVTHVSCPNHLYLFNGDLPYLSIWQNIVAKTDAKCFPAAHASAGFALYGLAYLPTLQRYRMRIFIIVTALGWIMGLYKMAFGDHFFSHTLVSMLLAWSLACGLAMLFFAKVDLTKAENMKFDPIIK
ncbi:PAP2 family lipid A phosphatase [Psychrobacter sp. ANT_WB68]|uniref:PAP2 family lipid A phosphatase n=1 Tax=Psychrobacter sp. ANT_WB68 TaxID=2597355 RepID=UPI0011F13554|nr:PAP2 family lipid A phosphatase [Psychrobacter sp. ANT_WB68]KAA0914081.1 PAP2 family lipid A phosphatase [Psychrobacter sp. ANT_WB68]